MMFGIGIRKEKVGEKEENDSRRTRTREEERGARSEG